MSDLQFSADAWREALVRVIPLDKGLAAKVREIDPISFAVQFKDTANPILQAVAGAIGYNDGVAEIKSLDSVVDNLDKIPDAVDVFNKLLIECIVEPQLKEQGHDKGLSVNDIPLRYKATIVWELLGGVNLEQAQIFRAGQTSNVVALSRQQHVRDAAQPDDGDSSP